MNGRRIIAIVGHPVSGKDTAAHVLTNTGFQFYSASDELRSLAPSDLATRAALRPFANKIRSERGGDFFVRRAAEKFPTGDIVIVGLRTLNEARAVRALGGKIVAVTAPASVRFQRSLARNRIGDPITLEEFSDLESYEASSASLDTHNVNALILNADLVVDNNGSLAALSKSISDASLALFPPD